MKVIHSLATYFIIVLVCLTACNKENVDTIVSEEAVFEPDTLVVNPIIDIIRASDGGVNLNCIGITQPYEFVLTSGETILIENTADHVALTLNDSINLVIDYVYPISITLPSGVETTVNNTYELTKAHASCINDYHWYGAYYAETYIPSFLLTNYCYSLVYPLNLVDETGNTYVASNETAFLAYRTTIDSLYTSFPFSMEDENGTTVTVTDLETFLGYMYNCDNTSALVSPEGIVVHGFGCLKLNYTIALGGLTDDGLFMPINSPIGHINSIFYNTSLSLQYPFSYINNTGDIINISNVADLLTALDACDRLVDIEPEVIGCGITPAHLLLFFNENSGLTNCDYTINYPLQVEAGGTTYTINTMADYMDVFNMYATQLDAINLVYPINATSTDGNPLLFNNDEAICSYIQDCE